MRTRGTIFGLLLTAALTLPLLTFGFATRSQEGDDNHAPVAEHLTLNTYQNIAISSVFSGVDPEGDAVTFQVVDPPARGQITLSEQDPATFWYTPYEDKKGKDTFQYVAIDANGNTSQPATVSITIAVPASKVSYTDLDGHPAHYAAQRLAEEGYYVGRQLGSGYSFDPEACFTREEFLALAMEITQTEPLEDVTLTGFSDDSAISTWAKGYVSGAVLCGAIQGSPVNGQVVFAPQETITQAQAVVMLSNLLCTTDVPLYTTTLATQSTEDWAVQSVANLEALSVLPASYQPSDPLTRGEAAQMLCAALDVMEERDSGWFW